MQSLISGYGSETRGKEGEKKNMPGKPAMTVGNIFQNSVASFTWQAMILLTFQEFIYDLGA